MTWLFNPLIFNNIILTLYALNILWWASQRKWADASYWFGAFWITYTVTYGYSH